MKKSSTAQFVALFDNNVEFKSTPSGWKVVSPLKDETERAIIEQKIVSCIKNGWPPLPGWLVNTSPGWDDEWMYLRLYALGAKKVIGPFPQKEKSKISKDKRIIVG